MTDAPPVVRRWPNAPAVLLLAVWLAYSNAVNTGFVFDDNVQIAQNAALSDWRSFLGTLNSRWLVSLSIVVNYQLGGLNPLGYHLFNVAVHAAAVLVLFGLLRRTLASGRFGGRYAETGEFLAFSIALLWAVHPLNTQAVTYVIQRAESMMGLFFLLTIYCWNRGATDGSPRVWFPLALLSYAACCHCKEVCVALPPVLWTYDRVFLADRWRTVLRQRWLPHLGILALLGYALRPVLATATATGAEGGGGDVGVGFTLPITPFQYLLTQTEVILHYLRLVVWPVGQCADMVDWPFATSVGEVWPAAVAVTALFLAGAVLLVVRPALGFAFAWFFLILGPTSSIVPINDAAFEHRMYLSLIGVLAGLVFAVDAALGKGLTLIRVALLLVGIFINVDGVIQAVRALYAVAKPVAAGIILVVVAVVLGWLTLNRNVVYRNVDSFREAVVETRPTNLRTKGGLVEVRLRQGRFDDAQRILDEIRETDPGVFSYRTYLGYNAYLNGRFERAADYYRKMLADDPWPLLPQFVYPFLLPSELAAKRYPGALEIARKHSSLYPQSASHQLMVAACELATGDAAAARTSAASAAARDPNVGGGLAGSARSALLGRHGIPAAQMGLWEVAYWQVSAANLADGDRNPEWLDTQAQLAARLGRFAEAVAAGRKGLAVATALADPIWKAAHAERLKKYEANQVYGPKD